MAAFTASVKLLPLGGNGLFGRVYDLNFSRSLGGSTRSKKRNIDSGLSTRESSTVLPGPCTSERPSAPAEGPPFLSLPLYSDPLSSLSFSPSRAPAHTVKYLRIFRYGASSILDSINARREVGCRAGRKTAAVFLEGFRRVR